MDRRRNRVGSRVGVEHGMKGRDSQMEIEQGIRLWQIFNILCSMK